MPKAKSKPAPLAPRFITTSINFDAKVLAKAKTEVEAPGSPFRSVSAFVNYKMGQALGLIAA